MPSRIVKYADSPESRIVKYTNSPESRIVRSILCRFLPFLGTVRPNDRRIYGPFAPVIRVGYAQGALQSGYTLLTPQFVDVNNPTQVSLNSIVPAGTFDSDEITINLLDDSGAVVRGWTWINWGGDSGDVECWSEDGSGEIAENETFTVGQAFWVQGSSEAQGIQSAGKVGSNDVTFQLRNGYTIAGNPFPTTIALEDIVPTGDVVSDDITINLLDDSGAVVRGWTMD